MEQKRIMANSRSEQLGILPASLSRRMPKPLGQLRDCRGPFGGNFCAPPNRASSTRSDTRILNGTHSRRGCIKATCHPIYKGFGQPTSHILYQLKFRMQWADLVLTMPFKIIQKIEKNKTTKYFGRKCLFQPHKTHVGPFRFTLPLLLSVHIKNPTKLCL